MSEKRYFWFKLYEDFFNSNRIKKLRKIAGGDTYTIIYLKMQLKALKQDGYLYFNGYFGDFYEELALDIDEDATNVRITCDYLLSVGLLEVSEDGKQYYLTYLQNCVGSETASAQRVRDYRQRKKEERKALHCNNDVTKALQCNTETLHCNNDVTEVLRTGSAEKEKEKEKDINSINTDVLIESSDKKKMSDTEPVTPATTKQIELIISQWNELEQYGITPVRIIGPNTERGKMLRARLRQYGQDSFTSIIEQIKLSDFLQGKNDRGWQVTFDWVVHPSNYPKVLEGKYLENRKPPKPQGRPRNFVNFPSSYANEDFKALEEQLLDN